MTIRTGIDLIEIRRLETLNPLIRERFFARVYTEREREICAGRMERYAARFAAKEAVSKALGTGIDEIGWKKIEIDAAENGAPVLILSGEAAAKAAALSLSDWSVSLTHTKLYTTAVVAAAGVEKG